MLEQLSVIGKDKGVETGYKPTICFSLRRFIDC